MVDSISDRTVGDSREQAAFQAYFLALQILHRLPGGPSLLWISLRPHREMEHKRSVEIKSKCIPLNRLLYPAMLDLVWQGTVSPQCRCVL